MFNGLEKLSLIFLIYLFLPLKVNAQTLSSLEVKKLAQSFQSELSFYRQNCVEDITLSYEKCVDKKNELIKKQESFESILASENAHSLNGCQEISSEPDIIKTLSQDISSINTKVTCSEQDKKYYKERCFDSLKCVMLSSGPKIPGVMKFMGEHSSIDYKKFRSKDECLSMNNDCGAKAMLGIAKSIQEMATGLWDLYIMASDFSLKASVWAALKAKEKWDSFWSSSSKIEDTTSDIALVASKLTPRNISKLYFQAELWKLQMMKSMWEGFNLWLNNTVYCGKWSGAPYYSECLRPTTHECSHCGDVLAGNCGLIGLLAIDLVDLFFTGGGASVGKWSPKIANQVFNSKKMINLLKKNKKLISSEVPINQSLIIQPAKNSQYDKLKEIINIKVVNPIKKIKTQLLKTKTEPIKQSTIDLKKVPLDFSKLKKRANIQDNPKLLADIDNLNTELSKLYELERKKNKIQKGDLIGLKSKKEALKKIDDKMKLINNELLKKTQKVFLENGVSSKIITDKTGVSLLQIGLDKKTSNLAQMKYLKLKNKYQAKKVAISPYLNISEEVKGSFDPVNQKILLDTDQIYDLLDNEISLTGKHESRHLIFTSNLLKNKKSIYHQIFKSNGTLPLNNERFYSDYMTAEELYNFSTDIGELARKYKTASRTKEINNKKLPQLIKENAEEVHVIAKTIENLTKNNISKLKRILDSLSESNLSQKDLSRLLKDNGVSLDLKDRELIIQDINDRKTYIEFISSDEKKLLKKLCKTNLITMTYQCNQKSLIALMQIALEKQNQLARVAEYQKLEALPLIELSTNILSGKTSSVDQLLLRSQQYSNNVKESYKGFVGNNEIKPLNKYDFYKDANDEFHKIAAIDKFMVHASYHKLDKSPSFLKDLNDIHLTGFKKDAGLDMSKGRKVSAFLKKYPEIEKSELMKLLGKNVGVLGLAKNNTEYLIGTVGSYYPIKKAMLKKYNEIDNIKGVKYLTESEREKLEIFVDTTGRLRTKNGELLDTTKLNNTSNSINPLSAIYVMDEDGRIYVHFANSGDNIKHSSFFSGAEVSAAGDITVKEGIILKANNRTGHYEATPEMLNQFVQELKFRGVQTDKIEPVYYMGNYPSSKPASIAD